MSSALSYHALGVDSITFACYDVGFWKAKLERFGFADFRPQAAMTTKQQGSAAMAHGDLRVVLVDPTDKERGPAVTRFLLAHGDMQVLWAGILVDDAARARGELSRVVACSSLETGEDPFGRVRRFRIGLPGQSTVSWEITERLGGPPSASADVQWRSRGVDHFAIAVIDLPRWEKMYHSLGFETIYVPQEEIAGEHSGMKTVAVQRGGWVVALVEGVDKNLPSQVTTYARAHGEHAIQHAAIRFDDLRRTLEELMARGVQFRLRRLRQDPTAPLAVEDVMHEGKDHSGPLLQCFTMPLARRPSPDNPEVYEGGFFFELIQRLAPTRKASGGEQAFHDPTVIGLYRSIEYEELAKDTGLIFAEMDDYQFRQWLASVVR